MLKKIKKRINEWNNKKIKKENEVLLRSLGKVLSQKEYIEVIYFKGSVLRHLAKLNENSVEIIIKDDKGVTVSKRNIDAKSFCENYSFKNM